MKKILLFILIASVALPGCKSMFAPAGNETILYQVTDGARKTDQLYDAIITASPDQKNYILYDEFYRQLNSLIDDIVQQEAQRKKGADLFKMATAVSTHFAIYRNEHEIKIVINNGEAQSYQQYMQGFWKPLIEAESRLK